MVAVFACRTMCVTQGAQGDHHLGQLHLRATTDILLLGRINHLSVLQSHSVRLILTFFLAPTFSVLLFVRVHRFALSIAYIF